MFLETCFSHFLLSLSSPFAAKIVRFLRLITILHDAKFISLFIWFLRLNKSLRICTKKMIMLLSQFYCNTNFVPT
jgi:hypothetical protein